MKALGVTGAGLIVGTTLSGCGRDVALPNEQKGSLQPNAILQITPDNIIRFYLPRAEMGQGIYTGLTTLVAEELDVNPKSIEVIQTGYHPDYTNPDYGMQVTGGSNSIRSHFLSLRQLAAGARQVLRKAAANQASIPLGKTSTKDGHVYIDSRSIQYGDLATAAALQPFPEKAPLKSPSEFRYIGKTSDRLDGINKCDGSAIFGIDVHFEGLYKAALKRCPQAGGTVKTFDSSKAEKVTGVEAIVSISNGVAVVATSYYVAKQALELVTIEWQIPETLSQFSSSSEEKNNGISLFRNALGNAKDDVSASKVAVEYWAPYLAHATMEPMNCTVRFKNDKLEIWTGTQNPELVAGLAALHGDIDKDKVIVHSQFMGGGFGRRGGGDYVSEAVQIAKATGLATQLIWSREDDIQSGRYRPASLTRFDITMDKDGHIQHWKVKRSGPNILPYLLEESIETFLPKALPKSFTDNLSKIPYSIFESLTVDDSVIEGLTEDYDAKEKSVENVTVDPGLPTGFWRSVGHSYSGFFKESVIDECAHANNQDPVLFRLKHLSNNSRLANVLETAANKAAWGKALPKGHYQGVACHKSFESFVAEIAEISIVNNTILVHKVTCVVDCGLAINPDIIKAQMEGGIIFGLTAALYGETTLKDGAVEQNNFHNYPLVRFDKSPVIEVTVVESNEAPTGVGEPGLPPIAGAVANAVFAATGKRLRSLPLILVNS